MQISGENEDVDDVSIYVHIPFCTKKCPFCNFYVVPDHIRYHEPLLQALLREWRMRLPQLQGKRVRSLYFGGGTPTKLPLEAFASIFQEIEQAKLLFSPQCEITLEANPEDLTLDLLKQYKLLGINRLSIGAQSFVQKELVVLGRSHDVDTSLRAFDWAHVAGFDNISLDLMLELPLQTQESLKKTLSTLQNIKIHHLSLYNLIFEPHTVFGKKREEMAPLLPSEEEKLALLEEAVTSIQSLGLMRYEISAFARPGHASVHNTGYWRGRPFLGLGPSAFSYWEHRRFSNIAHLQRYISFLAAGKLPVSFEESLSLERRQRELFVIQLRLLEGVSQSQFEAKHGPLDPTFTKELESQQKMGLLYFEDTTRSWILTKKGILFYDSLASELI